MLYYDQETGQFEADVRIINVDEDSNQVRISGSMRLNPIDKNYPDKKWININCIYDNNIQFTPEFIKQYKVSISIYKNKNVNNNKRFE